MATMAEHQLRLGGYKPVRVIGSGSFGTVYLCHNARHERCCVKRIQLHYDEHRREHRHSVAREIYLLRNLQHPRIVKCEAFFEMADNVYIVMEHAAAGNLHALISSLLENVDTQGCFPWSTIVSFFCDILSGLEYLHTRHVIHRDLKPENILVGADGRLKIADFGISKIHTPDHEPAVDQVGTYGVSTYFFMAPESIKHNEYNFGTDIWALGCILYELCELRSPFSGCRSKEDILNQAMWKPAKLRHHVDWRTLRVANWPEHYGDCFQELVDGMLHPDPKLRVTISWLVEAPVLMRRFYMNYFEQ